MVKKKVLLIEDEANIREVYSEVLGTDFEVIEARDGMEGLEKAMTGDWDIMLLDIMLPKKDGLEVLAEVKKKEELKPKPVLLLTNLGRDTIVKEGFNLGAAGYLVKSEITPGDVISTVQKTLNGDVK